MAASRPPSFQALYNRYRPQRFDELIGQEHVVRTLQNALVHNRLSHAYLFSGERGTGKTTAARLLAKAVNCLEGIQAEACGSCEHCQAITNGAFLDLIEMDAASHRGIDDIREIRELTQFAPGAGRFRVYIIDEVHQLSAPAKDALLKTLEEPPPQTLFVLATTEPHRVPATIRSRTQHLTFRRIGVLELTAQLRSIAETEEAQIQEAALHTLARNAGGSARDAVSLLDQALAYSDNDATSEAVNSMLGLTARDAVIQLLGHLMDGDAAAGLQAIGQAIEDGTSPNTLRQQIIDILRDILILKTSPETSAVGHLTEDEAFELSRRTESSSLRDIVRTLEVFAEPDPPSRTGVDATLELELAFARAVLSITEPVEAPAPVPAASETRPAARPSPAPAPARPVESPTAPTTPPPQPAQAAAGRPAAPDGDLSAAMIAARKDDWVSVIREEAREIAPYAGEAEVLDYADGTVTLGYRSRFLFERVQRPDALRQVARALSQVLDRPIQVRNEQRSASTPARRTSARTPVDDDPVVRVAMREYGATSIPDTSATGG
ncbi:MAG: DNA polymerase III subunit gamma/tau [Chloroflexi bacterium]|nr:DNA polymerase III subunit gamma/tau [Chloroflexota bacterium]